MIPCTLTLRCAAAAMMCAVVASAHGQSPSVTTFAYDAQGNVHTVTDGLGHKTTYTYDALSRRSNATDHNSKVTQYRYDGLSNLVAVTDARSVATSYTIDGLGNLLQTTSADTGVTVSNYDESGNVTSRTDAKQQKTTYRYDALNRVVSINYHDATTVSYTYDQGPNATGQLSQITDPSGNTEYKYDTFGRLVTETRNIVGTAYTTGYRYDGDGRLAGMTYPSGRAIEYGRDPLGRLNQISTVVGNAVTPVVANVTYQPFGPIQAVVFGNGRSQTRTYNADGGLASFSLSAQTIAVSYDAASRITGIADAANPASGTTYGYDTLDRLTNVGTASSAQTYKYDDVGNRIQKVINSAATAYSYGATNNRLVQVGAQAISTDANGSIIDKGNATFNYDARGRMVSANTAIGLVKYTINSLGQRVSKVTPTYTTIFHYDTTGKLIAESTLAGAKTTTQEYVYLGDVPVAVLK